MMGSETMVNNLVQISHDDILDFYQLQNIFPVWRNWIKVLPLSSSAMMGRNDVDFILKTLKTISWNRWVVSVGVPTEHGGWLLVIWFTTIVGCVSNIFTIPARVKDGYPSTRNIMWNLIILLNSRCAKCGEGFTNTEMWNFVDKA